MRLRPLSAYSASDLGPLLDEECRHWDADLAWDFREVAAAVAEGMERGTLCGRVAEEDGQALAYCYALPDARRVVVGSLFAVARARGRGLEAELLSAVIEEAQGQPGCGRVECQTLFSTAGAEAERCFASAGFVSLPRHYLVRPLSRSLPSAAAPAARLRTLQRSDQALASRVIHRSHLGSLDALLNQTYATAAQCRAFVDMLVERGGCGPFEPRASFLAEDARGSALGVVLGSRLSDRAGHICQVSVVPEAQGCGLGRTLVLAALAGFARCALSTVSLSVTVANRPAYRLYRSLGFGVAREFGAHAWVRPPARLELPA